MIGGLRGRAHSMQAKFNRVPAASRAHWWKVQFRGIVGFHAAFLGCTTTTFKELGVVGNAGARKVAGLSRRHNCDLDAVKDHFNVCVQTFFAQCIVKFIGHSFRHGDHPFSKLLSLPLPRRLDSLRSNGPGGVVSGLAQANFLLMSSLGFNVGPPSAGPLQVRGHSGFVRRWGEGWFWDFRDGGPGWIFDKHDQTAIDVRVQLLLEIFQRKTSRLPNMLADVVQVPLPLEDG